MNDVSSVSFGLAFLAGLASFLSPCVLPLVPSYLTFVSGMTLDELTAENGTPGRARAMVHASLFVAGFAVVFVALGFASSLLGAAVGKSLVVLQRVGGAMIVLFGAYLIGILRPRFLSSDRRVHLARRPGGLLGSFAVGVAFGAGWTPCVGPVLASILLYASTSGSAVHGASLLATYALGLGLPFLIAALALTQFLAGVQRLRRWLRPLEIVAGIMLVVVGLMLATGRFAQLSGTLAGLGQLFNVGS